MKRYTLRRVGGPHDRKSEECGICKRQFFKKVPFGHHFVTSWGSIDVCDPCAEDLHQTVIAGMAGGMFSLRRDVEKITHFLDALAKSRKWKEILKEAGFARPRPTYPKDIQKELNNISKEYDAFIKEWGKKIRPLRKKIHKLDDEQLRFKVEMNKKRTRLLRKFSQYTVPSK